MTNELTIPEEKEPFNFTSYPRSEKYDEDLWAPKKISNPPTAQYSCENSYTQPKYPSIKPTETFEIMVPSVKILFEIEQTVRIPVLVVKVIKWTL